jgi:hypothetical protein
MIKEKISWDDLVTVNVGFTITLTYEIGLM